MKKFVSAQKPDPRRRRKTFVCRLRLLRQESLCQDQNKPAHDV